MFVFEMVLDGIKYFDLNEITFTQAHTHTCRYR